MSVPTIPTQPIYIKSDTQSINSAQIQEIMRVMVGTPAVPAFRVVFIEPNIAYTYPQGGIGYTNFTKFISQIKPTSTFMDLGSTVINLSNVFCLQRITDANQPPNLGYRIRFWTTEKDEDLVYYRGSPEYKLLSKRFGL
jgi:hypothetical protein